MCRSSMSALGMFLKVCGEGMVETEYAGGILASLSPLHVPLCITHRAGINGMQEALSGGLIFIYPDSSVCLMHSTPTVSPLPLQQ